MTLQDALVAFKTYARAEGKSLKTIQWVTSSVGYFAEFLGPEQQNIAGITGDDLRRFIIALQKTHKYIHHPYNKPQPHKLAPHSIQTYCRAVRAFFGYLYREGFVEANPMEKVKMPKVPETIVPTLSEKEVERLLDQPNKRSDEGFRDYAIILTLVDTGMRLGELADLKADNVDYDQSCLRVMGKGSRERLVPFGRRVAKALMKYQLKHRPQPLSTDHFWLRRDGQALSASRIEKIMSTYGNKAGLKRCYAHKLRHTSSVMYLRNGGDVFSLQRKLGHKSLAMTRRYSNLSDSDVRNQHLRYGVADRLKL
ncbi:MAG: tyrosine-type recombinase/integrase [Chloroflexi bacterium]|nr:tyrosine-type recombinase/integrase [Chloroflexota bacterium]